MQSGVRVFGRAKTNYIIAKHVYTPGGGDSYMEQTGMLVGNFEINPLNETIWVWREQILTPKRDSFKKEKRKKNENLTSVSLRVILFFFAKP